MDVLTDVFKQLLNMVPMDGNYIVYNLTQYVFIFRAFDVELLYIAQKLNIPISEIPVRWTEIEGSKVTPVVAWIQMGCDLGLIWLKYRIGAWKIKSEKTE